MFWGGLLQQRWKTLFIFWIDNNLPIPFLPKSDSFPFLKYCVFTMLLNRCLRCLMYKKQQLLINKIALEFSQLNNFGPNGTSDLECIYGQWDERDCMLKRLAIHWSIPANRRVWCHQWSSSSDSDDSAYQRFSSEAEKTVRNQKIRPHTVKVAFHRPSLPITASSTAKLSDSLPP